LNAFFLLVDKPEVYNLPPDPVVPTKKTHESWAALGWGMLAMAAAAVASVVIGNNGGRR
jgi:formate dehydrogenase iron-sulfur subunit